MLYGFVVVACIASSCFQLHADATTCPDPFAPAPLQSLRRSYRSVRPSAPLRYARLVASTTCASPLSLGRLVPAVPFESLCQLHAPSTPVAACPVIRTPTGSSQKMISLLVLTTFHPYDA